MKRIVYLLTAFFILVSISPSKAQGIDDRAVIPVAVTLNSILRLTVTSGGNIEFNFNTLDDYQTGISTRAEYQTAFTVASSVNWNVFMYSENEDLIGTDIIGASANTMDLSNIGFHVTSEGTNSDLNLLGDPANPVPLESDESTILVGYDGTNSNAGDIQANSFIIHWECGTTRGTMNGTPILNQTVAADRYATNVFLVLQPD